MAASVQESSRAQRSRRRKQEGPRASLRQLLPFIFEHKPVIVLVVVLSVVGAVASLAQPLIVGQVITRVQAGDALGSLVWILVALVVVASVISGWQHYLLQRTGTAVVYSSRRRLIARILHLPISEFDARRTGDLVSRVGTDTTLLYAVLTQGLADSVGNALIFLGALVAMAVIDPVLLLLILVVIGASVGVVGALSGSIRRQTRVQQEWVGELASGMERSIVSIRTIRAAGAAAREQEAVTQQADRAFRAGIRVAKASALVVPVAGVALQVSLLVVLGVGGFRVAAGAISIASLVTFVMFLFMLMLPLGTFFGAITSVNQALGALGRIQEVLDLPAETAGDAAIAARAADAAGRAAVPSPAQERSRTDQRRTNPPESVLPPSNALRPSSTSTKDAASDAASAVAIEFRDVRFAYPIAVVKARRSAESEALALLESARVDTSGVALPDLPDATGGSATASPEGRSRFDQRSADSSGGVLHRPDRLRPSGAAGERAGADGAAGERAEADGAAGERAGADGAAGERAGADGAAEVLRGVSFTVPHGARVALVGPSGAGKSTALALIERFYDPTDGAILVHGQDVRTLDRAALRAQLGYVEQDAPTLAGTIADNLRLASPEASDADCESVLHEVNLTEVLERNPLGLGAPVGEAGVMLSGGERQRLAIARALLAAPPILLLDESTSSLDGLNEQRMREAIDAVAAGRTLIVIAHRLSTVVDSDHIVVMDHGRVVGQGTHAELVETTPLYRDLAHHQLLV